MLITYATRKSRSSENYVSRHGLDLRLAQTAAMTTRKQNRNRPFFKKWRKHKGLTQAQLAGRLEMSEANISRIENGAQDYTQGNLEAWAEALNCDVIDLFRDPTQPEIELWTVIERMPDEKRSQALKIIRAILEPEAA